MPVTMLSPDIRLFSHPTFEDFMAELGIELEDEDLTPTESSFNKTPTCSPTLTTTTTSSSEFKFNVGSPSSPATQTRSNCSRRRGKNSPPESTARRGGSASSRGNARSQRKGEALRMPTRAPPSKTRDPLSNLPQGRRRAHRQDAGGFLDDDNGSQSSDDDTGSYQLDEEDGKTSEVQLFLPHLPPEVEVALLLDKIRLETGVSDLETLRHGRAFRPHHEVFPPSEAEVKVIDLTAVMEKMELNNVTARDDRYMTKIEEELEQELREEHEMKQWVKRMTAEELAELAESRRAVLAKNIPKTRQPSTRQTSDSIDRASYHKRHVIQPLRRIKEVLGIRLPPTVNLRNKKQLRARVRLAADIRALPDRRVKIDDEDDDEDLPMHSRECYGGLERDYGGLDRDYGGLDRDYGGLERDHERAPWSDDEEDEDYAVLAQSQRYIRKAPWDDDDDE